MKKTVCIYYKTYCVNGRSCETKKFLSVDNYLKKNTFSDFIRFDFLRAADESSGTLKCSNMNSCVCS